MASNMTNKALERTVRRSRLNRWNKIVTGMAAVVVFCTTYALILPAITMEHQPTCGIEEHVHTEACWGLPLELTCTCQQEAGKESESYVLHTHNEFCYDTEGNLICKLPEIEEHVHDESCYTLVTPEPPHVHLESCWEDNKLLSCTLQETDGHEHTDECYEEVDELICKTPESEGHAHGEDCYDADGNLTCELSESEGHTHGDACYQKKRVLKCKEKECEAHHHTDSCYIVNDRKLICDKKEATADELANPPQPRMELTCGKPQVVLHTHTDGCYDENHNLICGKPEAAEHLHTKDCLTVTTDPNAKKVLVCGKEEHTHEKPKCYIDTEADLETPAVWEDTLPELTGKTWADDLLAVAVSQLDYAESEVNVTITPDGAILGYTRYGQWAGELYGEWSTHFVNFCLHYAGIEAEAFPRHEGELPWCEKLQEDNFGIYFTPDTYTPVPGDLVYFDQNVDGAFDRMGIVEQLLPANAETEEEAKLMVIEGDADNAVRRVTYKPDAPEILGFASTKAAAARWDELHPILPDYYCGLEEHVHTDVCRDENGELTCQIPEHTHSDECLVKPPVYICGLEEHTHAESCYDNKGTLTCQIPEHTHSDDCIEKVYLCGIPEHIHTDACKDAEGNLICTVYEHTHTDDCLIEHTYYCGQELHIHTETCRDAEGSLLCGKEEHIHNEDCLVQKVYCCGKEEHVHSESCKDAEGSLICGLEEHTHTDACLVKKNYRCGKEMHVHGETCKDAEGNLICTLEEHTHNEECIVYIVCGKEEHTHTDACRDAEGNLICGKEAHTHGNSCRLVGQSVDADIQGDAAQLTLDEESAPRVTVTGYMPEGVTITAIPLDIEGALFAYDVAIYDAEGKEFQPLIPVQVNFFVPGITDDPENEVEIYHGESAEAEESIDPIDATEPTETAGNVDTQGMTRMDSRPDGKGGIVVDAPHFSPFAGFRAAPRAAVTEDNCELWDTWYKWIPATNDNPFGSAQHFNVFILGDVVGFNAIHGNAAIGGSVYGGKNTTIGYPEGSNFNYEADSTAENEICLILRGSAYRGDSPKLPEDTNKEITGLPTPLEVANGTAVVRDDLLTQYEYDTADKSRQPQVSLNNYRRPQTHIHQVPVLEPDNTWKFDQFFWDAGMDLNGVANNAPDSLVEHNQHIYDYAYGLYLKQKDEGITDPHLGYNDLIADVTEEMLDAVLGEGHSGAEPNDVFLHGDNPFYNVFNVQSDKVAPTNGVERKVWLDVPVGSYVVINVLGREDGKPVTVIPDFGMQFWYRNTRGQWTKQPAEIRSMQGEGFNQSQMLLLNMDPAVTDVTFCTNNYFQASILAPKCNMHCSTVNLEGTIVFKSMKDLNEQSPGNNNIVYSPFYTGTSMWLTKEMICDTTDEDHSDINEGGSGDVCMIDHNGRNGVDGWPNYYADVRFSVSDTLGGAGLPAVLKELPLDGKPHNYGGLHPGYYTVEDELIYIKANNGGGEDAGYEYKERRLTVDEDGYWMVAMYLAPGYGDAANNLVEDPNANQWTYVYCTDVKPDGNGSYTCSIPNSTDQWLYGTSYTFENGFVTTKVQDNEKPIYLAQGRMQKANETAFNTFRHHWNYGLFSQNGGPEKPTLTIQSNNPVGYVTLGNHYSIEPEKTVTVYKEWGEDRQFDIVVDGVVTGHETIFVPVAPPPGAEIQVTLYRRIEGGKDTIVDPIEPTEANPSGLPNPVTLHGPDNWFYMWTGLPAKDSDGKPYIYTVKETSGWPGWDGKVIDNGNGSFTIENREKKNTGLQVNKEWYDADGVQLTQAEIDALETETGKKMTSTVQLYREKGRAPVLEDYKDSGKLNWIAVYLNEVSEDNFIKTIPYFPGSDVDIAIDLYMAGGNTPVTNPSFLHYGNMNKTKLLMDGKDQKATITCDDKGVTVAGSGVYWNKAFTHLIVTKHFDNLSGFPTLIVSTDKSEDSYTPMPQVEIDKVEPDTIKNQLHKPDAMLGHSRYNPAFIQWDNFMEPFGAPIVMENTMPDKWVHTWDVLPKFQGDTGDVSGTEVNEDVCYGYYVVEVDKTDGYTPIYLYSASAEQHTDDFYQANPPGTDGIRPASPDITNVSSGFITVRNYPDEPDYSGPPLPDCGGIGTIPYTLGGLLTVILAVILMQYNQKKRRKEGNAF